VDSSLINDWPYCRFNNPSWGTWVSYLTIWTPFRMLIAHVAVRKEWILDSSPTLHTTWVQMILPLLSSNGKKICGSLNFKMLISPINGIGTSSISLTHQFYNHHNQRNKLEKTRRTQTSIFPNWHRSQDSSFLRPIQTKSSINPKFNSNSQ
jgi:hypothetical protein